MRSRGQTRRPQREERKGERKAWWCSGSQGSDCQAGWELRSQPADGIVERCPQVAGLPTVPPEWQGVPRAPLDPHGATELTCRASVRPWRSELAKLWPFQHDTPPSAGPVRDLILCSFPPTPRLFHCPAPSVQWCTWWQQLSGQQHEFKCQCLHLGGVGPSSLCTQFPDGDGTSLRGLVGWGMGQDVHVQPGA